MAKSLTQMTGKYVGPTKSGYQEQFQINANMSIVQKKETLESYFGRVPVYKAGMSLAFFHQLI